MGITRVDMFVTGDDVVIAPIDLSFDGGNGKVLIESDVTVGDDVAERLGYDEVKLHGGLYNVDYSQNDPYGRIIVNADLIP